MITQAEYVQNQGELWLEFQIGIPLRGIARNCTELQGIARNWTELLASQFR